MPTRFAKLGNDMRPIFLPAFLAYLELIPELALLELRYLHSLVFLRLHRIPVKLCPYRAVHAYAVVLDKRGYPYD